jgi:uncharacterized protein (TIGR00255 family)
MNSMTGYGRGEATNGDVSVVVEMKSVNNRFRDVQMRVPRDYMVLEPRIQAALKDSIQRGRIEIFVRRNAAESGQGVQPDVHLAERYYKAIKLVAQRLQRPEEDIPLALIVAQPGVLTTIETEADALTEWDLANTAVQAALDDLLQMRKAEGDALQRDLRWQLDEMMRLRAEVAAHSEGIAERLRARLEERLLRLVADRRLDPSRLAQEAAILADKADVSEELVRIESHCVQFGDALNSEEPVGRRLDFLLQELNREINTVGSKAAESAVAERVVEMKSVLERMREQVANVE